VTEDEWWASLRGEEMELNISGDPPYDVDRVVGDLVEMLRLPPRGWLLDFGCGTGRPAERVVERVGAAVTIIGVDVNDEALARFRLATGCPGYEEIPVMPLDGAYSVTVFQHLYPSVSREAVRLIADRLKPGARFVFQFVVGTESSFASHQVSQWTALEWVQDAGLDLVMLFPDEHYEQWRWVVAEKGTP
jgi:cyclopropane fatty-acyl-phospholipid synthase-like methyltransferase